MREFSIVKQRILQFLDFKEISKYQFYKFTGITNGILSQTNGISEENLLRFLTTFPEISAEWLLRGEGAMTVGGDAATAETNINNGVNNGHIGHREAHQSAPACASCTLLEAKEQTIRAQQTTIQSQQRAIELLAQPRTV